MATSPYTEFFLFTSKALPKETFHVVNFHGTEGLNQLFSFTINLVSQNASVDAEKVLAETATLTIKRKTGPDAIFTGYPARLEQGGFFNGYAYYQLELRPAFWKLTQAVQSAIFLKKNVQSVVKDLLTKEKFFTLAHDFKLTKSDYPTPEFAMQYGESIYEYILWRIEEQGIYFYFTPDGDKIIFADGPSAHNKSALSIRYSPVTGLEGDKREEVLTTFTLNQTPLPQKVIVRSYDWKKPNKIIVGNADVSKAGVGTVYLAGENAETEAEANRLAKIRAEELICRSRIFTGAGSVPVLRPGVSFTLTNHYNQKFNRDYVVTEITHEGAQETFLTMGL
ncbi:MAG: type VI secretion system tip protein VgrG, partial [Desulfovibrionaceae bacterium]|nr:type VI secretion system tip protein VgrG [Desulfovibrionaceae bacterium]